MYQITDRYVAEIFQEKFSKHSQFSERDPEPKAPRCANLAKSFEKLVRTEKAQGRERTVVRAAQPIIVRFCDPECNERQRDGEQQGDPGSLRLTPLCHILFRPLMNRINIPCRAHGGRTYMEQPRHVSGGMSFLLLVGLAQMFSRADGHTSLSGPSRYVRYECSRE